jgi:hypothetical protein
MAWIPTLPPDPIAAQWWREAEARRRREDAVGTARRRGRTRRRIREVNAKLAAVEAAAEVRSARELLPPSKRRAFDRGLTASARDAAIELRGDVEYDEGVYWWVGSHGIETARHVPDRPW